MEANAAVFAIYVGLGGFINIGYCLQVGKRVSVWDLFCRLGLATWQKEMLAGW